MKTKFSSIKWKASKDDSKLIGEIAKRANKMAEKYEADYAVITANIDLAACHLNGMPLNLDKLLKADDFNFCHDVFGIRKHINRTTGQLEDCFVPRCALSNHPVKAGLLTP